MATGTNTLNQNMVLSVESLKVGGTAVTPTAAEMNILAGVTSTAAEINKLDDSLASNLLTRGAGVDTAETYATGIFRNGTLITTRILVDISTLIGSATDLDVIGESAAASCHWGQITAAKSGTLIGGRVTCLEVPAGGTADLDFYSSTRDSFQVLDGPPQFFLPRVFNYFDDIIGTEVELYNDYTGQRLALEEFNQNNPMRKFAKCYHFARNRLRRVWQEQLFILHDFAHPDYNTFISDENQQLPLASTPSTAQSPRGAGSEL